MRCRMPGCTGTIVDGYCDVCGLPPATTMPVGQGTAGSVPASYSTGPCPQLGCGGRIVDGYCDVCGSPATAPAPVTRPLEGAVSTRTSAQLGSIALGSARVTSFGERLRRRKAATPESALLGAGLAHVPPAPAIDPAKAVLANPLVPEARRVCPRCGAKVGQAGDGVESRSEGFCPQCGAPYSFTPKLRPGEVLAGQYKIVGALAHGGMGWIYLARDQNVSDRWVVLKGLLNAGDSDAVKAAISEQQYLARVTSPLIVEIYNFVTHKDAGYIVMEYVGGRSLKQLLKQRMEAAGGPDPLPADQALAFLIEILPAFSYLHGLGLLYCDFKPDNVIQVGDSLKLIDLGGVRHIVDDETPIFGTVGYQAPEIAARGASIPSDIFTIGRTLMVLCADVPGYQSKYEFVTPPAEEMPAFAANDSLYRLLLKCCAPEPDDRFTSPEELRLQMLGVLRETVAQLRGAATTSVASPLFTAPTGIGDRPGWQYLPQLRVDLGADTPAGRTLANAVRIVETEPDSQLPAVDRLVTQVLQADPWEWRAVWVSGMAALRLQRFADAQAAFNVVYGQMPGELAPKLALAVACELGGQPDYAEELYRVCVQTDAAYVSAAAFGLARIRAANSDLDGVLAALAMVPVTSRGYPEALRLRAHHLVTLTAGVDRFAEAMEAIDSAPLPARSQAAYQVTLLRRAADATKAGPAAVPGIGTNRAVRERLETALRQWARLTDDPTERAELFDQANAIQPWRFL